eukprot:CAMPEP_0182419004 /NCGR_PEP_ID=MMETSP1167-20130531/3391_1 /TAXON_ID=2988 /ORGANISM="Mallomonas Sp, Strain CCMP3275" /LENGTH=155 /DNA_ID=CAMNT_0024593555 /DNA_START=74 /DNA_END=540 /DNA_ORIENTATION=-
MSELHVYMSSVNNAVARQNGKGLALLLAIPVGKVPISKSMIQIANRTTVLNPITYCASNIADKEMAGIIGRRLSALASIVQSDWTNAYQHQLGAYNALLDYFKDDASYWIIPALTKVMNDLRLLATQSDIELKRRDNEFLKDASDETHKQFHYGS